eukprot:m.54426 g.54426  ORF g.54426 m.54426 type:complete len:537 (-) comp21912_c0_seq1:134-1744(-)
MEFHGEHFVKSCRRHPSTLSDSFGESLLFGRRGHIGSGGHYTAEHPTYIIVQTMFETRHANYYRRLCTLLFTILICVLSVVGVNSSTFLLWWVGNDGCRCVRWWSFPLCEARRSWINKVCPDRNNQLIGFAIDGGVTEPGDGLVSADFHAWIHNRPEPNGDGGEQGRKVVLITGRTTQVASREVAVFQNAYVVKDGHIVSPNPSNRPLEWRLWFAGACGPEHEYPKFHFAYHDILRRQNVGRLNWKRDTLGKQFLADQENDLVPEMEYVVSLAGRWSDSPWHFPAESLCGLAPLLPLPSHAKVHVTSEKSFVLDWLELVGVSQDMVVTGPVRARTLVIPKACPCGKPDKQHLTWLHSVATSEVAKVLELSAENVTSTMITKPSTLLLIRRTALHALNKRHFSEAGFKAVYDALFRIAERHGLTMTVFDDAHMPSTPIQLRQWANAAIVVAPHGAALVNMLAMKPNQSCVVELRQVGYEMDLYRWYASQLDVAYIRGPDFTENGMPSIKELESATQVCVRAIKSAQHSANPKKSPLV